MEEMKVRLEKDLENNFKKRDRERALLVSAEVASCFMLFLKL